ncbi:MAG: rhomboid family intramembrane serine protease [Dehalococcoidia bacterium]|nr:rhomboid family intramembrane serine protease [Dehalococcoidia bacterium]
MIPIGDSPRPQRTAYVNYALIALNVAVFLYMLTLATAVPKDQRQANAEFRQQESGVCYTFPGAPSDLERFYCRWSFQPKEFFDNVRGDLAVPNVDRGQVWLSILTSLFLHAGWLHILGNMLFLWVFGDNVEDRLGHAGYLVFYLLAGVVASLLQGAIDATSVVPVVGASGAIAGVLGAYIVYYPRATISVVIPFFILIFIPLPVPALVMIGLWFLQNLLAGFATIGQAGTPDSGVAFFAHVGGFLFGMFAVLLFLRRADSRRAPPRWRTGDE